MPRTAACLLVMNKVCPKCGAENVAASIHCRNCRVKLPATTAAMLAPGPVSRRWASFLRSAFWALVLLGVGAAGFWASRNTGFLGHGLAGAWAQVQAVQKGATSALQRWSTKWLSSQPLTPPRPASEVAITSVPAPLQPTMLKIRCKRCEGLGYTIVTDKKNMIDVNKKAHTITETKRKICLLCDQQGGRTIVLPVGAEVCPACFGMGRIVAAFNAREQVQPCAICVGKGYIIRKY